jgi:hypothetical protein
MTITPERVRNLRKGDLVRLRHLTWEEPIEGRLHHFGRAPGSQPLYIGGWLVRGTDGNPPSYTNEYELELLEKCQRFYVNIDRDPVIGDVCRIMGSHGRNTWSFREDHKWHPTAMQMPIVGDFDLLPVVLLVDGSIGLPPVKES